MITAVVVYYKTSFQNKSNFKLNSLIPQIIFFGISWEVNGDASTPVEKEIADNFNKDKIRFSEIIAEKLNEKSLKGKNL